MLHARCSLCVTARCGHSPPASRVHKPRMTAIRSAALSIGFPMHPCLAALILRWPLSVLCFAWECSVVCDRSCWRDGYMKQNLSVIICRPGVACIASLPRHSIDRLSIYIHTRTFLPVLAPDVPCRGVTTASGAGATIRSTLDRRAGHHHTRPTLTVWPQPE